MARLLLPQDVDTLPTRGMLRQMPSTAIRHQATRPRLHPSSSLRIFRRSSLSLTPDLLPIHRLISGVATTMTAGLQVLAVMVKSRTHRILTTPTGDSRLKVPRLLTASVTTAPTSPAVSTSTLLGDPVPLLS